MTGLEKILQTIDADARKSSEAILAQAEKEADGILASAKAQAEQKCLEIAGQSEQDMKSVLSRASSGAALLEKKMVLDAKQLIISEIINKAMEKLECLPDKEYFDIILQLVKKHAHNSTGVIRFSDKDMKRLPKDFDKALKDALTDRGNASLSVDNKPSDMKGGFILVYGDIEENCSFEALFSSAKEELQDKVNAFLFD